MVKMELHYKDGTAMIYWTAKWNGTDMVNGTDTVNGTSIELQR